MAKAPVINRMFAKPGTSASQGAAASSWTISLNRIVVCMKYRSRGSARFSEPSTQQLVLVQAERHGLYVRDPMHRLLQMRQASCPLKFQGRKI